MLVSKSVSIGGQVLLNPENNKVTFYAGTTQDVKKDDDDRSDDAKFSVNGKDVKVTANVMMPDGRLKVNGGDEDNDSKKTPATYVTMTGLFVAAEVEGEGKNVIWSSFDCRAPPVAVTATSSMQSFVAKEEITATTEEVLKVTVMPNPSTTYFTLKLESRVEAPVSIVVMDASGRVIDAKSKLAPNSTIQIGHNYINGKYYAEIMQGTTRKTVQLMKVK